MTETRTEQIKKIKTKQNTNNVYKREAKSVSFRKLSKARWAWSRLAALPFGKRQSSRVAHCSPISLYSLISNARCATNAGHSKTRCSSVSQEPQNVHDGLSTRPCRYRRSRTNTDPTLNLYNSALARRGKPRPRTRGGNDPSATRRSGCCFRRCRRIRRRAFSNVHEMSGQSHSWWAQLEARRSASSFPAMPTCEGTHWAMRDTPQEVILPEVSWVLHNNGLSASCLSLLRAARESVRMTTFKAFNSSCTYFRATSIAASSAVVDEVGCSILNTRLMPVEGQKKAAEAPCASLCTDASVNISIYPSNFSNRWDWAN